MLSFQTGTHLSLLVLALSAQSCKNATSRVAAVDEKPASTSTNEVLAGPWQPGDKVTVPGNGTMVFKWGDDDQSEVVDSMQSSLEHAAQANPAITHVSLSTTAGYGIYGAADPFATHSYGIYLQLIPIKAGSNFVVMGSNPTLTLPVIKSDAKGILYPYGSDLPLGPKQHTLQYAVVLRDPSVIATDQVIVLGPRYDGPCSQPKPVEELPQATGDMVADLKAVLNFQFIKCTVNKISETFNDDSHTSTFSYAPDSDEGALVFAGAVYAGNVFAAGGVDPKTVDFSKLDYCKTLNLCMVRFFMALTSALHDQTTYTGNNAFNAAQATAVAQAVNLVPSGFQASDLKQVAQQVIQTVNSKQPDLLRKIRTEIAFYYAVVGKEASSSMLTWKKSN